MTTPLLHELARKKTEARSTISVTDAMAGQETLRLSRAILLYEGGGVDSGRGSTLATVHDVRVDPAAGRPEICPGSCLTQGALDEMLRSMAGLPRRRALLPGGMLTYDGGRMAWWSPPRRAPIFFKTGDKDFTAAVSGKIVLHPPLLFVAEPCDLYVYALAKPVRPDAGAPVCRAPYFNIWERGHMCAGNVKLPETVQPEDIALWEKAFFETNFTHANAGGKPLVKKPHTHESFWRMLAKQDFPNHTDGPPTWSIIWEDYLDPLGLTVDQVINRE